MIGTYAGSLVTTAISNAHPKLDYELDPGDLLTKREDGNWTKECPGIMIHGFVLTEEQEKTLKDVQFSFDGLFYTIHDGETSND